MRTARYAVTLFSIFKMNSEVESFSTISVFRGQNTDVQTTMHSDIGRQYEFWHALRRKPKKAPSLREP
jgi:hypothetical protein